jgi:CheY-like chemotaxis protein
MESVDAAVLDINLNGQTSYQVADALAARGLPFVFSTGYAKDRLSKDYGDVPVLQKPFHRFELGQALEIVLSPEAPGRSAPATGFPKA